MPTQAVRQQSPGVDGGRASPLWGSNCACVPACALCMVIPLFPHPVVLCAISQTPSHPQRVIQPLPTTRSLPFTPTRASSPPPGASLTALLPTLSFLHLEGACGGVVSAVATRFLTQAPCPLADPGAACPAQPGSQTAARGCRGGREGHSRPRAGPYCCGRILPVIQFACLGRRGALTG